MSKKRTTKIIFRIPSNSKCQLHVARLMTLRPGDKQYPPLPLDSDPKEPKQDLRQEDVSEINFPIPNVKSDNVAIIYQSELDYISRCILDCPDIETGGQLFGYWNDQGVAVVLYAIGPGPRANHQTTFFQQDVPYLQQFGQMLIDRYDLQHIGEWHSHHRLGLAHPSGHDAQTMYHGLSRNARHNLLLCIGNCDMNRNSTSLNAFVFRDTEREYYQLPWVVKPGKSLYRQCVDSELHQWIYQPKTMRANMRNLLTLDNTMSAQEKPKYSNAYWLNDKENNAVLMKMMQYIKSRPGVECKANLDSNGLVHLMLTGHPYVSEIYFDSSFPWTPPRVKARSRIYQEPLWTYDSYDIYEAFVSYFDFFDK